jgi:hypothetical protein
MRGLVLVVRVDGCGQPFAATGGRTIDDVGDALAAAVAGSDATFAGATVNWPAGAARAMPGDVVRLTHPTGTFIDYDGVGLFEGSALPASQKGLPLDTPAGEATVLSVTGDVLTLSTALAPAAGDRVLLGSALPASFADGDASRALAGQSGATFAKVLVDPSGRRRVPHHRAVDVVRDNRIRPQLSAATHHSFAIPPACADATVTTTLLYRPTPADLARQRGWEARDYVVQSKATQVTIP